MRQFIKLTLTAVILCATASYSAEGYFEFHYGPGIWASTLDHSGTDTTYRFTGHNLTFAAGIYTMDGFETVLEFDTTLATTNNGFMKDGTRQRMTNTDIKLPRYLVRNMGLGITEYFNFPLLDNRLVLSPCVDARFARYDDYSLGSEYFKSTTDYWTSSFRLGLRVKYFLNKVTFSVAYKYPFLGLITDRIWNDNRREDDFQFLVTYDLDDYYAGLGMQRYALVYTNPVLSGTGDTYLNRVMVTIFATVGLKF